MIGALGKFFLSSACILAAIGAAAVPVQAEAQTNGTDPSFDCSTATSRIDRAICADAGLAKDDALMAQLYAQAQTSAFGKGRSNQLSAQRQWLKYRNSACTREQQQAELVDCLGGYYESRIAQLAVAIIFTDPDQALPIIQRHDAEGARLIEAIYVYTSEPAGSDWSAATLMKKRDKIGHLLDPAVKNLQDNDRSRFGWAIVKDSGVSGFDDIIASDNNFATFLNVSSAYLDGYWRPLTMPCAALIRNPQLIAARQPIFGSSLDGGALTTDCADSLPSTPNVDRLAKTVVDNWEPCDGTIRFAYYRSFDLLLDSIKLGLTDEQVGDEAPASLTGGKGVTQTLVQRAVEELTGYYLTYDLASPDHAPVMASDAVAKILDYDQIDC